MAICANPKLYAQVALDGDWQQQIVEMFGRASPLYSVSAIEDEAIVDVMVLSSARRIRLRKRSGGSANLMLTEACPYTAIAIMAICKRYAASAYNDKQQPIILHDIQHDLPHLAGVNAECFGDVIDAAAALGLAMQRLKPKAGSHMNLFAI